MALNIKPLSDRVIVEPAAAETQTASGIIIPDTAKEKPQKGTVLAIGNGKKDEPMTVKVGDTVLYGKYAGTDLKLDGKDYLIVKNSWGVRGPFAGYVYVSMPYFAINTISVLVNKKAVPDSVMKKLIW